MNFGHLESWYDSLSSIACVCVWVSCSCALVKEQKKGKTKNTTIDNKQEFNSIIKTTSESLLTSEKNKSERKNEKIFKETNKFRFYHHHHHHHNQKSISFFNPDIIVDNILFEYGQHNNDLAADMNLKLQTILLLLLFLFLLFLFRWFQFVIVIVFIFVFKSIS